MKKHRPRPGKPNRPARPRPKSQWPAGDPRWLVVDAVATIMAKRAEQVASGEVELDADLLKLCAIVDQVKKKEPDTIDHGEMERVLLRVSSLEAYTLPGLMAKLEIALMVVGTRPEPDEVYNNLDRMLLWLLLSEVFAIFKEAGSEAGAREPAPDGGPIPG